MKGIIEKKTEAGKEGRRKSRKEMKDKWKGSLVFSEQDK